MTKISPTPWTVRPYDDGEPIVGIADAAGGEVCYAWIASEDLDYYESEVRGLESNNPKTPKTKLRPRAEIEADLQAACDAVNGKPEITPSTPRPWRVSRLRGWKEEIVLSLVGADDTEIATFQEDQQTAADFDAIMEAVNLRWSSP